MPIQDFVIVISPIFCDINLFIKTRKCYRGIGMVEGEIKSSLLECPVKCIPNTISKWMY